MELLSSLVGDTQPFLSVLLPTSQVSHRSQQGELNKNDRRRLKRQTVREDRREAIRRMRDERRQRRRCDVPPLASPFRNIAPFSHTNIVKEDGNRSVPGNLEGDALPSRLSSRLEASKRNTPKDSPLQDVPPPVIFLSQESSATHESSDIVSGCQTTNTSTASAAARIIQAVNKEKLSDLRRLVKVEGVDLNNIRVPPKKPTAKNEFPWPGWTPLHIACWRGNVAILRLLIEKGADVNIMNDHNQAPLHIAALRGHEDACRELIQAGAAVDVINTRRNHQTPLHVAAIKGHHKVLDVLLDYSADIEHANANPTGPQRALQLAIKQCHPSCVESLLDRGAYPDHVENGDSALAVATTYYHDDIMPLLISRVGIDEHTAKLALHRAAIQNNHELARLVLTKLPAARIFQSGGGPYYPLHTAVSKGHRDLLRVLLCPENVNQSNDKGESPLHVAASSGNEELVSLLLQAGAQIGLERASADIQSGGMTALMLAAKGGYAAVVKTLLQNGADADHANGAGNTALHVAAGEDNSEIVRLLVSKMKDINATNNLGHAPLHVAAQMSLHENAEALLKAGADVNIRNRKRYGFTALHFAASNGSVECVEVLAKFKADLNATKSNRVGAQTAIEMADSSGYHQCVDVLKRLGAVVRKKEDNHSKISTSVKLLTFKDTVPPQFLPAPRSASAGPVGGYVQRKQEALSTPAASNNQGLHGPWRTVRLFISSTFADMHAERDYLIKNIIPQLRERCTERRLHLVDIDLRWGVTEEESKSGKVLEVCLDQISNSELFCCMLGDRYGWVPDWEEIPIDVKLKYHWVKESSVTAMEIEHALKREKTGDIATLFYSRNSSEFAEHIPSQIKHLYQESSSAQQRKQTELKRKIAGGHNVFEYQPVFGGINTANNTILLDDLEEFGERFLQDVWAVIDRKYPYNPVPPNPILIERSLHEEFKEVRNRNFVGRRNVLDQLRRYIRGDSPLPLVLSGDAGSGKSAIMGHFADSVTADDPSTYVITHFVGGTPSSTSIRDTLIRFNAELTMHFGLWLEECGPTFEDVKNQFWAVLESVSKSGGRAVIVLDALNQLDHTNQSHSLEWLPPKLPKGTKLVISCLSGDCLEVLKGRGVPIISVGALTVEDKVEIVTQTLSTYQKKLQGQQLDLLMQKQGSNNPLYLVVACEELRVFGSFERITAKISDLPDTLPLLFDQVLERLEKEHGKELVKTTLSLLERSRHGLLEKELLELLSISSSSWSSLFLSLKLFLRPISKCGEGLLDFFHRQLAKAVTRRYGSPEWNTEVHNTIATYFMSKLGVSGASWTFPTFYPRAVFELPYHLTMAHRWEDVTRTLGNIKFIQMKCLSGHCYDLVEDYLRLSTMTASGWETNEDIEDCRAFVTGNLHVLSSRPQLCYQQAINTTPTGSKMRQTVLAELQSSSHESAGFMEWLNRSIKPRDPAIMSLVAHSEVNAAAFSPDGSVLVAALKDGKLKAWKTATGEQIAVMNGHSARVTACSYSPCGRYIASSGGDGSVHVWSGGQSYTLLHSYSHHSGKEVLCCKFSSNGRWLASCGEDGVAAVWPFSASGASQGLKVFPHPAAVTWCSFSPDGSLFATASVDKNIRIHSLEREGQEVILRGHSKIANCCEFSPDSKRLVSCGQDKTIKIWATNGALLQTLQGHSDNVSSVAFSPISAECIISASWDKTLKTWDTRSAKMLGSLSGHGHFLNCVAFSADGRQIASGSVDMSLRIYDTKLALQFQSAKKTGEDLSMPHTKMIRAIHRCPVTARLVTASWDCTLKVLSPDGHCIRTISGHSKRVNACRFSADGKRIVSGSMDNTVRVWEAATGDELLRLSGHTSSVLCCDISHDGKYIVSGACDGTIRLWDAESGDEIGVLSGHDEQWVTAIAFSPYSRRIASGAKNGIIKIWDSESGVSVETLEGHSASVLDLKFSADGKYLASAAEDKLLRIWKANTLEELVTLHGHTHEATAVSFMENTRYIVSAGSDKTIRLWDIETAREIWSFHGEGAVMSISTISTSSIAAGDSNGMLYIIAIRGSLMAGHSEFAKMDLRVGKVLTCRKHEMADNLYVSTVDVGEARPRQIISGLARYVPLSTMPGRLVVVLCNCKASKIKGIDSQAMIVGVAKGEGDARRVELLNVPNGVSPGERVYLASAPDPPPAEKELDFNNYLETVQQDLYTNAECHATYKGEPWMTSKGIISTATLKFGAVA